MRNGFLFFKVLLRNRAEAQGRSRPPRPSFLSTTLSKSTSTEEDEGRAITSPSALKSTSSTSAPSSRSRRPPFPLPLPHRPTGGERTGRSPGIRFAVVVVVDRYLHPFLPLLFRFSRCRLQPPPVPWWRRGFEMRVGGGLRRTISEPTRVVIVEVSLLRHRNGNGHCRGRLEVGSAPSCTRVAVPVWRRRRHLRPWRIRRCRPEQQSRPAMDEAPLPTRRAAPRRPADIIGKKRMTGSYSLIPKIGMRE